MTEALLTKKIFVLKGLACSSCAAKIERAVQELSFVHGVELNFATTKLMIVSNALPDNILTIIQEIAERVEPGIKVIDVDSTNIESVEKLTLEGLGCSNCASKIEAAVNELAYVREAKLNFATSSITIKGQSNSMNQILQEVQKISDRIEPGIKVKRSSSNDHGHHHQHHDHQQAGMNWRLGLGTLLFALAIFVFETPLISGDFPKWVEILLYGSSYVLIGGPIVMIALRNIAHGQIFDENFLMTIATVGAFMIGEFPEGVAVMFFYMIGELFQERAVDHSRRSIRGLMDIRPDYANLRVGEEIQQVSPETVHVGEIIIIKPGERVPLDGKVIEGVSMVDTSALTGESVPRKLTVGDSILSGMINKDGLLTIEVEKEFGESTVAKILDLVENATSKKAPTEKFITKFARYYTPFVVYSALTMAIIPPIFFHNATFADWFYRALIFLVISCPCALVVSIPLGFFGGIGLASREGILVKGGNYLEALNQVRGVVFDKTGTLTKGVFQVNLIQPMGNYQKEEILEYAALAESHSTHPIARSIMEAYQGQIDPQTIELYQEVAGEGVCAKIAGHTIYAGNAKLLQNAGIEVTPVIAEGTIVYIGVDDQYAGYVTISDELKPDAVSTIKELKDQGIGEIYMLTGDRENVAQNVAEQLGLAGYYAELLPNQKVEQIETLLTKFSKSEKLIFVGDGINDAPVLARADIGVAMGGLGSDAAIEAADVVLMTDEPAKLVTALKIARQTKNVVWQNIIMALGVKGGVLLLGALGLATMWEAVFADVGVALLAVLNAMRILRVRTR